MNSKNIVLVLLCSTSIASAASFFSSDNFTSASNFTQQTWEWTGCGPAATSSQARFVAANNRLNFISDGTSSHALVNAWWNNPTATTSEPLSRTQSWVLNVKATNNALPIGVQQSVLWVDIFDGHAHGSVAYDDPRADCIEVTYGRYGDSASTIESSVEVGNTDSTNDKSDLPTQFSNVLIQVSYNALTKTLNTGYSYDGGVTLHALGSYSTANFFNDSGDLSYNPQGGFVIALGAESDSLAINSGQVYFSDFSVTLLPEVTEQIQAKIYTAVEVSWQSVTGQFYQVQYTPSLSPATWTNFGSPVVGDGTEKSVYDQTRNRNKQFYRVLVLQ